MDLKDPNTLNLYQYVKGSPLKYVDYSGHESINEDYGYLFRTANMAVSGSFTNDFTVAGLGIQLGLGFVGADFPCDVRDFAADVTVNKDVLSLKWWGTMVIDVIAFIPVIGEVKYLDEVALGIKMAGKNGDELLAGGRQILKAADPLGDLKAGGTALDGMPDGLRGLKNADVLNNAKYVDDLAEGGLNALSTPSSKVLRQNLIDAGVEVPDYSNAAHHIVAGNSPKTAEARAILQKYGVDINNAANGVFLPTVKDAAEGAYHPSLHTNLYYDKVNKLLSEATCKEDVLDILEFIGDELSNGTFMQ